MGIKDEARARGWLAEIEAYVNAVKAAPRSEIVRWLTVTCPECGETRESAEAFAQSHGIFEGFVIVGCEFGRIVNPNAVGIAQPDWPDWADEKPVWETAPYEAFPLFLGYDSDGVAWWKDEPDDGLFYADDPSDPGYTSRVPEIVRSR